MSSLLPNIIILLKTLLVVGIGLFGLYYILILALIIKENFGKVIICISMLASIFVYSEFEKNNRRQLLASQSESLLYYEPVQSYEYPVAEPEYTYYEMLAKKCSRGKKFCEDAIVEKTVSVISRDGVGSGFILRSEKNWLIVATAGHVIESNKSKSIQIYDGNRLIEATNLNATII